MQLEVGKCYVDRNGRVFGPLQHSGALFGEGPIVIPTWYNNGAVSFNRESSLDLIAEYIPETVPKWRMLQAGELIQSGDEYYSCHHEWVPVVLSIGCKVAQAGVGQVRRRIVPHATSESHCARFFESAAPVASPRDINYIPKYADGWKPEQELRHVASGMLNIIFHRYATNEERQAAASTLVEAVYPELLARKQ